MKQTAAIASGILLGFLILSGQASAQGRGRGRAGRPSVSNPGSLHSNAAAGTPAYSGDRDFGRERAAEVGEGQKNGLEKENLSPQQTGNGKKEGRPKSERKQQ